MKKFEVSAYGVEEMRKEEVMLENGGGFWNTVAAGALLLVLAPQIISNTFVNAFAEGMSEGVNDYNNAKK